MIALVLVVLGWTEPPTRFAAEVMPVLSRAGCAAGACHGRTGGRGGMRLSLLGSAPRADWAALTREAGGRRVNRVDPAASLLVRKATGQEPHGGGPRFAPGSDEAAILVRWVAAGTPDDAGEPAVVAVAVEPTTWVGVPGGSSTLRVVATWADATSRDVTALSTFAASDPDLAAVDPNGRVRVPTNSPRVGEGAVLARYAGQNAAMRVVRPRLGGSDPVGEPDSGHSVDRLVAARLRRHRISASPPCTDREFARRAALDLNGVLPTPAEVDAFLADPGSDADRRARFVEGRVDRPEFADLFALKWSGLLRNRRTLGSVSQPGSFAFHDWIRQAIAANWPFDRFAAALLTAQGDAESNPAVVWYREVATAEDRADEVAQVFLGTRIACARCHRHPTDRWTESDHRGFAAIFDRVGTKPGPDPATPSLFLRRPPTGPEAARPRPLGGSVFDDGGDPRVALAEWLRRPDNPFFGRAIVNRTWKHFLGRGLVEPEDDFRADHPATDPALLDALAEDFRAHDFDFQYLVRVICTSRAYGRSSLPAADGSNRDERDGFSRFLPRRLPAEVLFDAISTVTGSHTAWPDVPAGTRAVQLPDDGFASTTLDRLGRPRRLVPSECERTSESHLAQSLHLLGSEALHAKITDPAGRAARMGRADPSADPGQVAELYRVALGREPDPDEASTARDYLGRCRRENRAVEGYEDLVWSLLNTKAFLFVH